MFELSSVALYLLFPKVSEQWSPVYEANERRICLCSPTLGEGATHGRVSTSSQKEYIKNDTDKVIVESEQNQFTVRIQLGS